MSDNSSFILDLKNPANIYLLGLFWADGYLSKGKSFSIELTLKDFDDLKHLFLVGKLTFRQRTQNEKNFGNPLGCCRINDRQICSFLKENDFQIKSKTSPDKLLSLIDENLHHYFYRGYFDGDGCLYIKTRNELAFWSSIDQDWNFILSLYKKLDIQTYKILKYSRKNGTHKSSCLVVRQAKLIKKFCDYIYSERNLDKLGLTRKYEKYLSFLEKYEKMPFKSSRITDHVNIYFIPHMNKWRAHSSKPRTYLGYFATIEEAKLAQQKFQENLAASILPAL